MTIVTPIRIRPNQVVQIANIPHDLSKDEADTMIRVIMAHVDNPPPKRRIGQKFKRLPQRIFYDG